MLRYIVVDAIVLDFSFYTNISVSIITLLLDAFRTALSDIYNHSLNFIDKRLFLLRLCLGSIVISFYIFPFVCLST